MTSISEEIPEIISEQKQHVPEDKPWEVRMQETILLDKDIEDSSGFMKELASQLSVEDPEILHTFYSLKNAYAEKDSVKAKLQHEILRNRVLEKMEKTRRLTELGTIGPLFEEEEFIDHGGIKPENIDSVTPDPTSKEEFPL